MFIESGPSGSEAIPIISPTTTYCGAGEPGCSGQVHGLRDCRNTIICIRDLEPEAPRLGKTLAVILLRKIG